MRIRMSDTSDVILGVVCPMQPTVSNGWLFLACLLCLWTLYIGLGMLYVVLVHKRCDYPNRELWEDAFEYVRFGATVVRSQLCGCCAKPHSHSL